MTGPRRDGRETAGRFGEGPRTWPALVAMGGAASRRLAGGSGG